MAIRMVGLDLDGTLLNEKKELTDYTRLVLSRAIKKGVTIVIATGRPVVGIPEMLRTFPGVRYAVTANGARVMDLEENRCIYEKLVSVSIAREIFKVYEDYDTLQEIYFDGVGYAEAKKVAVAEHYAPTLAMADYLKTTRKTVPNLKEKMKEMNQPIDKAHAIFRHVTEKRAAWKRLENRTDITLTEAYDRNIEVNAKGVNKGLAMIRLGRMLGISRAQIMACGDGLNDYAMLKEVGLGISMENGHPKVKEIADDVTDTNENDGVAKAIERFVLEEGSIK